MTTIVDGLKYQQALRTAGVEAEQATKMAEALSNAVSTGDLVTKADLKAEIAEVKASLIMWMIGTQFGFAALIVTLIKFTGH